ncbi:sensor histidine kinase [Streptomyces fagopyri]|uniref:sensor histidine kinase n=1 Tax=Streptomyces fagopyri TaxID=2662397 RepID=UPI00371241D9
MPLNADRNRWAAPTLQKPFIARSRCLVGWWAGGTAPTSRWSTRSRVSCSARSSSSRSASVCCPRSCSPRCWSFDPEGRVTVINDEARHLLGLGTALGSRLDELLPEGRLRRALDGSLTGTDITVLTDDHCLAVNRMPVTLHGRALGAVVTVRDRTELVGLLRELDSVRGLTDALRAQQHEFTNRMHTLAGVPCGNGVRPRA